MRTAARRHTLPCGRRLFGSGFGARNRCGIIDKGHFTLSRGAEGLAGVHAVGTFEFTLGIGGTYVDLAHFDQRPE